MVKKIRIHTFGKTILLMAIKMVINEKISQGQYMIYDIFPRQKIVSSICILYSLQEYIYPHIQNIFSNISSIYRYSFFFLTEKAMFSWRKNSRY